MQPQAAVLPYAPLSHILTGLHVLQFHFAAAQLYRLLPHAKFPASQPYLPLLLPVSVLFLPSIMPAEPEHRPVLPSSLSWHQAPWQDPEQYVQTLLYQ